MENCSISVDKSGWEFKIDGEMIIGRVDSGSDDPDYEWFVRDLGNLDAENPGWVVTFPERYRGQHGKYEDGARFMSVERPDGRSTTMEFIYRRLPWKFCRSVGVRYEKGQEQRQLPIPPDPEEGTDKLRRRKHHGQRKGKGRSRRDPKHA